MTGPRAVALGGGHGLAASLAALRQVTESLTAIVTVADNGGSSGRLRRDFGVLPPGDLRMALAALCGDDEWGTTWSKVVQHRFAGDRELAGHAVGNLLIVALWDLLGDTVAGLDWVGRLLGTGGRVLPMAAVPLDIVAEVVGVDPAGPDEVSTVRGQAAVASTPGQVRSITLLPPDPPAVPEAVRAVHRRRLDRVRPRLVVHQRAAAPAGARARRRAARRHGPARARPQPGAAAGGDGGIFATQAPGGPRRARACAYCGCSPRRHQAAGTGSLADLEKAAAVLGARLMMADVAAADGTPRHDPRLLAGMYAQIFKGGPGGWSPRSRGFRGSSPGLALGSDAAWR